jgi:hypothetical protein
MRDMREVRENSAQDRQKSAISSMIVQSGDGRMRCSLPSSP